MPNKKNAIKSVKQDAKTTTANTYYTSTVRNAIKKTEKAISAGDKALADTELKKATKSLDNAKSKGLVHRNKVDREKSRLSIKVNKMEVK